MQTPCLWRLELELDWSSMQAPHGMACPTESVHTIVSYSQCYTITLSRSPSSLLTGQLFAGIAQHDQLLNDLAKLPFLQGV